jgi:hypothetical protein
MKGYAPFKTRREIEWPDAVQITVNNLLTVATNSSGFSGVNLSRVKNPLPLFLIFP